MASIQLYVVIIIPCLTQIMWYHFWCRQTVLRGYWLILACPLADNETQFTIVKSVPADNGCTRPFSHCAAVLRWWEASGYLCIWWLHVECMAGTYILTFQHMHVYHLAWDFMCLSGLVSLVCYHHESGCTYTMKLSAIEALHCTIKRTLTILLLSRD